MAKTFYIVDDHELLRIGTISFFIYDTFCNFLTGYQSGFFKITKLLASTVCGTLFFCSGFPLKTSMEFVNPAKSIFAEESVALKYMQKFPTVYFVSPGKIVIAEQSVFEPNESACSLRKAISPLYALKTSE